MDFKVGDICSAKYSNDSKPGGVSEDVWSSCCRIVRIDNNSNVYCYVSREGMAGEVAIKLKGQLKLIERENSMENMSLVQRMKLIVKGEPEKTLQKTGITDEQDNLTADGREAFLGWMLEKNKVEFAAAVATPLLADQEVEKKN